MELKNLSKHTKRSYLAAVKGIAKFYNQAPDNLTKEKIEDYLLYLKRDKGNAPNSCCAVLSGLRFFYKNVAEKEIPITYSLTRKPRKLPQVLPMEDILNIIHATNNLKHKMILMTTYSAGLRASETLKLKSENIDSKAMLIKVEEGICPCCTPATAVHLLLSMLQSMISETRFYKTAFQSGTCPYLYVPGSVSVNLNIQAF